MDTNERKTKLEILLQKQKEKERNDEIQKQLGWILEPFTSIEGISLLDDEEREKVKTELIESIPIIEWVSIDLEKMNNKFVMHNVSSDKVALFLNEKGLYTDNLVYLFLQDDLPPWSTLPWVKMPLSKVIENITHLATKDSYQQCVYCPSPKFVIEFVEPDLITIAW